MDLFCEHGVYMGDANEGKPCAACGGEQAKHDAAITALLEAEKHVSRQFIIDWAVARLSAR